MRNYRFYKKEHCGKIRWWVDIKPWAFPKRLLIMYSSAEKWLDKIAKGKTEITITTSTKNFLNAELLYRYKFEGPIQGTTYIAKSYKKIKSNHKILLCPVTLYVFGRYPKIIYYKVV